METINFIQKTQKHIEILEKTIFLIENKFELPILTNIGNKKAFKYEKPGVENTCILRAVRRRDS